MRLHRFYVNKPLGEELVVEDREMITQWMKVLRYTEGDFVILFNGDGNDVTYKLVTVSKTHCSLHKQETHPSYIPTKKVTLFLSLIKKDNVELVVQKVTELGVSRIVPIISERSEKRGVNVERLRKIAQEAGEQSGRGDLPIIDEAISLEEALNEKGTYDKRIVFQIGAPLLLPKEAPSSAAVFVGPEGGWTPREENLFKEHELSSYSLGKTVLRAETASIVGCYLVAL